MWKWVVWVVVAAELAFGVIGKASVEWTVRGWTYEAGVNAGKVSVWSMSVRQGGVIIVGPGGSPKLTMFARQFPPPVGFVFAGFDARRTSIAGRLYYFAAIPIWFAELVWLVGPLLWVRHRRRRSAGRGFAVVTPAGGDPAEPTG